VPGSGSSCKSRRNQFLANALAERALATLVFDMLTSAERRQDALDQRLRFDVGFLARRLACVTDWLLAQPPARSLPIGYLGAGTAAAAAIVAAAEHPARVRALVLRAGSPGLAGSALQRLSTPTLLLVGSEDTRTLEVNELAMLQMPPTTQLTIVPDAGHRFEEPGALAMVSELAADWFLQHLAGANGELTDVGERR
jgi:pimeloyl-ACP methyl ester carboxylesterase